jgi:hypothetical protein
MIRIRISLACIFLLILLGCSGKQAQESQSQPPEAQQAATQSPETLPPAVQQQEPAAPAAATTVARTTQIRAAATSQKTPAAGQASSSAPVAQATNSQTIANASPQAAPQNQLAASASKPATPPQPRTVIVPGGTELSIRLQDSLDSGVNKTGDAFQAILDKDLVIEGQTVAARGSALAGKVVNAASAGRVEGRAAMSLTLTDLKIASTSYPIRTNTLAFEAESTVKKDATKVGLGAGIGAVIGAIAGGGKGAAIGAAVGGGAGTATVLATKGKELSFPAEHQFSFTLGNDLPVQLR